MLHKDSRKDNQ